MWNSYNRGSWLNRLRKILEEQEKGKEIQEYTNKKRDDVDSLLYIKLTDEEKKLRKEFWLSLRSFELWKNFYRYIPESEK